MQSGFFKMHFNLKNEKKEDKNSIYLTIKTWKHKNRIKADKLKTKILCTYFLHRNFVYIETSFSTVYVNVWLTQCCTVQISSVTKCIFRQAEIKRRNEMTDEHEQKNNKQQNS